MVNCNLHENGGHYEKIKAIFKVSEPKQHLKKVIENPYSIMPPT